MFRVPILAVGLLTAVGSLSNVRESVAKPMTVADAIETTRFMRAERGAVGFVKCRHERTHLRDSH